jgi:hypothetical protein
MNKQTSQLMTKEFLSTNFNDQPYDSAMVKMSDLRHDPLVNMQMTADSARKRLMTS